MGGGAWWAAVHGVSKSRTWLNDFPFTFHFHALEKEMATYSSVLAWRILGTGEPGGLPSMGSHRVRHDWSDLAAAAVIYCYVIKPLKLGGLTKAILLPLMIQWVSCAQLSSSSAPHTVTGATGIWELLEIHVQGGPLLWMLVDVS